MRGWRHWVREWQGVRRKERHLQVGSAHRLVGALIKAWICWRALRGLAASKAILLLRERADALDDLRIHPNLRAAKRALPGRLEGDPSKAGSLRLRFCCRPPD